MLKAKILLDRSGSMSSNWVETIGSINGYVEGLIKAKTEAKVSLIAFDSTEPYLVLRDDVDILHWEDLTPSVIKPRGSTPLYDALGHLLGDTTGDKVIVIVVTDGMENCSKEFSQEAVKDAVKKATDKGWEIIFLSANLDFNAKFYTQTFGMADTKFVNTSNATRGATMGSLSAKSAVYGSSGASVGFTKKEQDEAEEK